MASGFTASVPKLLIDKISEYACKGFCLQGNQMMRKKIGSIPGKKDDG
jgi:hypothetical protein